MWWLPPDFESLQWAPALQEVVARHFDNARQWSGDRKQEHLELMIGTADPRRCIAGDVAVEASRGRGSWLTWNETVAGGLGHSNYGSLRFLSLERSSGNSTLTTCSSRMSYSETPTSSDSAHTRLAGSSLTGRWAELRRRYRAAGALHQQRPYIGTTVTPSARSGDLDTQYDVPDVLFQSPAARTGPRGGHVVGHLRVASATDADSP
jgi:hypothetical protein